MKFFAPYLLLSLFTCAFSTFTNCENRLDTKKGTGEISTAQRAKEAAKSLGYFGLSAAHVAALHHIGNEMQSDIHNLREDYGIKPKMSEILLKSALLTILTTGSISFGKKGCDALKEACKNSKTLSDFSESIAIVGNTSLAVLGLLGMTLGFKKLKDAKMIFGYDTEKKCKGILIDDDSSSVQEKIEMLLPILTMLGASIYFTAKHGTKAAQGIEKNYKASSYLKKVLATLDNEKEPLSTKKQALYGLGKCAFSALNAGVIVSIFYNYLIPDIKQMRSKSKVRDNNNSGNLFSLRNMCLLSLAGLMAREAMRFGKSGCELLKDAYTKINHTTTVAK